MLYLASTSPRRRELLAAAGLRAVVVEPGPEPVGSGAPRERALQRALAKAQRARVAGAAGWVIGADTVVAVDGVDLGQPADRDDAARMLRLLAGRDHLVHTAQCVRAHPSGPSAAAVADAIVRVRPLSEAALQSWLARDLWRGKAGAYGIQDPGQDFITLVAGDLDTVIGLSVRTLRALFAELRAEVV